MGLVHYATSHNYPLIMSLSEVLSVEENDVFTQKFKKKSSYRGRGKTPSHTLPPLRHFAPLLWPPLIVLAAPLLLE